MNKYQEICATSPRLAGILDRLKLAGETDLIEKAYQYAVAHGGIAELDHVRPKNQVFNSRPARIAIILLNEAKIRCTEIIAAGMLACANQPPARDLSINANVREILEKLELSCRALMDDNSDAATQAAVIKVACRLDRARHIHLACNTHAKDFWHHFVTDTQDYISLAELVSPPLQNLLISWEKSFTNRFLNR